MKWTFFCFAVFLAVSKSQELAHYNVDPHEVAAVGVSAGAYMANQVHFAFSKTFVRGSGVVAGGPYHCARGDVTTAQVQCMYVPGMLDISPLVDDTRKASKEGLIDNIELLRDSKIFLYSGTADTVVNPGVGYKAYLFFQYFLPQGSIHFENTTKSQHAWITADYGNECAKLGLPYISNCKYDSAGAMITWLFGAPAQPRGTFIAGHVKEFDQAKYTAGRKPASISLGEKGFLYVPESCEKGDLCKLIVAFHGCEQTLALVTDKFVVHTGLNEWAETNGYIIVYPQVIKSPSSPQNPNGCFDWWGYCGGDYAWKSGPQMVFVKNVVDAIIGK